MKKTAHTFRPDSVAYKQHLLLGQYGRAWNPAELPAEVEKKPEGYCYQNAYHLVIDHPDLTYVEGYADSMKHAWCVDAQGNVIDPTWTRLKHAKTYYGIAFNTRWVLKSVWFHPYNKGRLRDDEGMCYPVIFGDEIGNPAVYAKPHLILHPKWYRRPDNSTGGNPRQSEKWRTNDTKITAY
jgi:hypothetical protein